MNRILSRRRRGSQLALERLEDRTLLAADPVITELLASNAEGSEDGDRIHSDWIELFNAGDESANLAGWFLTDDRDQLQKWPLPNVQLAAGQFLQVFASGQPSAGYTDAAGSYHTNFRLSANGETLALVRPDGTIQQDFAAGFPPQATDVSFGFPMQGNEIQWDAPSYFTTPTPAAHNTTQPLPNITTHQVSIVSSGSTFTDTLTIELLAEGRPIHYTTDGSLPDDSSPRYQTPLQIDRTTHLRARVIEPAAVPGPVVAETFLRLSADVAEFASQLPIVVIDNGGGGEIPNSGWNQTNAGIQQVPRQTASLSIFEPADSAQLRGQAATNTRIGIRVRGAFSSSFRQPGYSVEAWEDGRDVDSDVSLLGMTPAADWVFYAPNPDFDRTLIDNSFMFHLSNQVGHWAPKVRYVEVFLNTDGDEVEMSDHAGLFAIVEKVERADGRLDFDALARDGTEGGWLLEVNRMDSITEDGLLPKNFHTAGPDGALTTERDLHDSSSRGDDIPRQYNAYINFDDPNGRQVTAQQRDAIEGWFREMEDILYGRTEVVWNDPAEGYAKYIDVDNFVDYMHFNNLSANGDGLLISLWLYNSDPANGGKLRFGPIWDVDLGSFEGSPTAELMRRKDRLWYGRLFDDPDFEQRFTDRWFELRAGPLANTQLLATIELYRNLIGEDAAERDGVRDWPNRLAQMERWITRRADAMDAAFLNRPEITPSEGFITRDRPVLISVSRGEVYYTLDGTDPRQPGGTISPTAKRSQPDDPLLANANLQITARTLFRNRWSAPVTVSLEVTDEFLDADLNLDGFSDRTDIQLLCAAIQASDPTFDLNQDESVDHADLDHLLAIGWETTRGDVNLDGLFDSSDLVQIFVVGKYERNIDATYTDGDWNCDGRFDSSDLVAAFAVGNYNR